MDFPIPIVSPQVGLIQLPYEKVDDRGLLNPHREIVRNPPSFKNRPWPIGAFSTQRAAHLRRVEETARISKDRGCPELRVKTASEKI